MFPLVLLSDERIGGSANGRNGLTHVTMWRAAPEYRAVRAQEVFEWRYKHLRALYTSVPLSALLWTLTDFQWPLLAVATVFIYLGCYVLMRQLGLTTMELKGHALEIVISADRYGRDMASKLEEEARVLHVLYGQFDGWTRDEVRQGLQDQLEWARNNAHKYE